ncbi:6-phosphogluconolactonase [Legionella busanensis]|uniref:6-phosphogluconolactonase n=1 Tax=Legionella busanensis TaxID=190655 RepID=A0A378JM01_9GAMM|nr:6-phosphogluconolactonase [Legionella busanensis]STX51229.1 6-phosphogluconolactonase [Legionella busanensis]
MHLQQFNDPTSLNSYFCNKLKIILNEAIAARGHAYLVVSGGKTPQSLFNLLSKADLAWDKVTILLADERWIPPSSDDSNEGMLKRHLLVNNAAKANYISLLPKSNESELNIKEVAGRLANLPQFDAVILGMGEDGHTASLFPCSKEIKAGLTMSEPAVIIVKPSTAPYTRISLTKNRLLNSRYIFLHLVGENKMAVLKEADSGQDPLAMPIRAFLHNPAVELQVMFSP